MGEGGFIAELSSVLCVVCVCEGRRSRDLHGSKKTRARYGFGLRILSSRTRQYNTRELMWEDFWFSSES